MKRRRSDCKRARNNWSYPQTCVLRAVFVYTGGRPTVEDMSSVACILDVTYRRVQVWFYNHRVRLLWVTDDDMDNASLFYDFEDTLMLAGRISSHSSSVGDASTETGAACCKKDGRHSSSSSSFGLPCASDCASVECNA